MVYHQFMLIVQNVEQMLQQKLLYQQVQDFGFYSVFYVFLDSGVAHVVYAVVMVLKMLNTHVQIVVLQLLKLISKI